MDENEKNELKLRFPNQNEAWTESNGVWQSEEFEKDSNQYFAVASEHHRVVRRFVLKFRSGRSVGVPYAVLPVTELEGNSVLKILAHDISIMIAGRNLEELRNYFHEELVTWIKESPSGTDTGEEGTFISNITIQCKYIDEPLHLR